MVDVLPGRVAVVDLETDAADDLDLTIVVKASAEADEDRAEARFLDRLEHSSRV